MSASGQNARSMCSSSRAGRRQRADFVQQRGVTRRALPLQRRQHVRTLVHAVADPPVALTMHDVAVRGSERSPSRIVDGLWRQGRHDEHDPVTGPAQSNEHPMDPILVSGAWRQRKDVTETNDRAGGQRYLA